MVNLSVEAIQELVQQKSFDRLFNLLNDLEDSNLLKETGFKKLGDAYFLDSEYNEALACYLSCENLQENDHVIHNNIGVTYQNLNLHQKALFHFEKSCAFRPDYYIALFNLGISNASLGNLEVARGNFEDTLKINPKFVPCLEQLADYHYNTDDFNNASKYIKFILNENNSSSPAYLLLGKICFKQKQFDKCEQFFQQAIKLDETNIINYIEFGNVAYELSEFQKAKTIFSKALDLNKNDITALLCYGGACAALDLHEEAVLVYKKILELDHSSLKALKNLAVTYMHLGSRKIALKYINSILKIDKGDSDVYRYLVSLVEQNKLNDALQTVLALLNQDNLGSLDKANLSFAAAKASERLGNFDTAYHFYVNTNSILKENSTYNIAHEERVFEETQSVFLKHFHNFKLDDSQKNPVFIVGLPRSGTTLVEQLLSQNKQMFPLGEKNYLLKSIEHSQVLKYGLSNETVSRMQSFYLKYASFHSSNDVTFIDKMPANFKLLGFAKLMFPNSKILFCKRDPLSLCWSNYQTFFTQSGNDFSLDFSHLAHFYGISQKYLELWNELFGIDIYSVEYEKLVSDPKFNVQQFFEFLQLEFNETVLNFYMSNRGIGTASNFQVKEAINDKGVKRVDNFRPFLTELENILNI